MHTTSTIQERLASADAVALVKEWLKGNRGQSLQALARYVCEALELKDARRELRIAGTVKALRVLGSRGYWRLPKGRSRNAKAGRWRPRRLGRAVARPREVPARADQVQGLKLREVRSEEEELFRTWNELVETEHPLRDGRMVGRQLRYLIGSEHGWLGAVGFGSCALRLADRDEWIGWDEPKRREFQDRVLDMRRFLIRPCVRCENLASRVLSLVTERVGADFERRYGFEPWLLESFVNTEAYEGTCYQAANWVCVGESIGRGRNGPIEPTVPRKDIYVYELNRRWRHDMGIVPKSERITPLSLEESLGNAQWVAAEFGAADLGHLDATERLVRIAQAKALNPSAPYTECFAGDRHELKAYYRFINKKHERMNPTGILSGHRQETIRRIKGQRRVLAVQDTTDLDFSDRLHCNDLGDIGKNQTGAVSQGLKMHSLLPLSESGLLLGVLGTNIYASHFDGEEKAQVRPIEEKESFRWLRAIDELVEVSEWAPETELIAIGDRESDLFELFDYRRRKARHIHLLVRARYDRCLSEGSCAEDEPRKLFAHLESLPVMAEATISVPRQREKKGKPSQPGRISLPARRAKVQLRWERVTVNAPQTSQTRHMQPVDLWAVMLTEADPPEGAKPLRWVLLTTVPIESRKQALRCLRWYTRRWRIEEWHRVLKSGCRIEAHQHQSAGKLACAIAIDAVMAWRVMLLILLGREAPDLRCDLIFEPWECRLLEALQPMVAPDTMPVQKKSPCPSPPPTSSSPDSAERSTATPANYQDPKPSCADFDASATSASATESEKEHPYMALLSDGFRDTRRASMNDESCLPDCTSLGGGA
jgi:hypothetical protein